MKIEKSSLAAALLELGEENAAVLLIRAPLPELLDTEHDMPALTRLGLDSTKLHTFSSGSLKFRQSAT